MADSKPKLMAAFDPKQTFSVGRFMAANSALLTDSPLPARPLAFTTALLLLVIHGCAERSHEYFVLQLNNAVGQRIDANAMGNACWAGPPNLKGMKELGDGKQEYKYVRPPIRDVGPCAYTCIVHASSRIVTNVSIQ